MRFWIDLSQEPSSVKSCTSRATRLSPMKNSLTDLYRSKLQCSPLDIRPDVNQSMTRAFEDGCRWNICVCSYFAPSKQVTGSGARSRKLRSFKVKFMFCLVTRKSSASTSDDLKTLVEPYNTSFVGTTDDDDSA